MLHDLVADPTHPSLHSEEREKKERAEIEEKDKLANAQRGEILLKLQALESGVEVCCVRVDYYKHTLYR